MTKIHFGIRSFWPKWSFGPFWTILVQYTFRQYRGHFLKGFEANRTRKFTRGSAKSLLHKFLGVPVLSLKWALEHRLALLEKRISTASSGIQTPTPQSLLNIGGEKKTNKHKQLPRIALEMGWGLNCLCVSLFLGGKGETHKQNSQEISGKGRESPGTVPWKICLCVLLVFFFHPKIWPYCQFRRKNRESGPKTQHLVTPSL